MTRTNFRLLLIASLIVSLLGGIVDFLIPGLVPEAFHTAQKADDRSLSIARVLAGLAVALIGAVLYFASVYGLYRFRSWAPRIAVAGTVLILLACPLFGTFAQSGLAVALSYLASYLWGAVVILGYTSGFREQFPRSVDSQAVSPK